MSIFTDSLKTKLKIDYSIYRIYKYEDNGGTHYLILTENKIKCDDDKECFDYTKAFCFNLKEEQYHLEWKLKDFILPNGNEVLDEYSIYFSTKYFELNDYDNDVFVHPIIIYGTHGRNGKADGRIKILVYHNGKKE